MVLSRLQKGLINLRKAPRVSRLNCQKKNFQIGTHIFFLILIVILIEIFFFLKRTMYHKYNLHTKNTKNKNKLKSLLSSMLKLRSAQSHMLLFVICFSSQLNLVITL
jgi:hypothetical protein